MELSVIILCVLLVSLCNCQSEPKCFSKFDYDEKFLLTLLRIEGAVQTFNDRLTEVERKLDEGERARNKTVSTMLEDAVHTLNKTLADQRNVSQHITGELRGELLKAQTAMKTFLSVPRVAFTVASPKDDPASGRLGFSTVYTNVGGDFNPVTGEFTCSVPGIYQFSFHLVKKYDSFGLNIDKGYCYLGHNGINTVLAYTNPSISEDRQGYHSASSSAVLELKAGDKICLQSCYTIGGSAANALHTYSCFSGVLIMPDIKG